MKKAVSIILAAVMLCSFAVVAFADETGVEKGTYQTDVTGTYVEGTVGNGTVYCVDIEWSDMSFTYHSEKAPVWNVTDHTYSETVPAYWEGSGSITVTNHSNAVISIVPKYVAEESYADAEMIFSMMEMTLDSAANGNEEKSGTIEVIPSGFLPANTEAQKIGSISVTIADSEIENMTAEELYNQNESNLASLYAVTNEYGSSLDSDNVSAARSAIEAVSEMEDDGVTDVDEVRAAYIEAFNAWHKVYAQYEKLRG